MEISFFVPVTPVPKGRPQINAGGRSVRTPTKTVDFEYKVAYYALAEARKKGWEMAPPGVPARLDLKFFLAIPASWPQGKKNRPPPHTSRPDIDNLAKAVKDALNGIIYTDDCQVNDTRQSKQYSGTPGILISISTYENKE
jgi:Holliday junction resolvase RusA-like endonuclease